MSISEIKNKIEIKRKKGISDAVIVREVLNRYPEENAVIAFIDEGISLRDFDLGTQKVRG